MTTLAEKKAHVRAEARKPHRNHPCHARNCIRDIPPAYFMCPWHWRMVPRDLQGKVWQHYNAGQENGDAGVSAEYLRVTAAAIAAVAEREARAKKAT